MEDKNNVSPVVKVEKFLNGVKIEGKKSDFDAYSKDGTSSEDFFLPFKTYAYYGTSYEIVNDSIGYNSQGMMEEAKGSNGIWSSITYGYNNSIPIAKATNAKHEDVLFENFEEGGFVSSRMSQEGISKTGEFSTKACYVDWGNWKSIDLKENTTYKVSYWTRKGNATDYSRVYVYNSSKGFGSSVTITPPSDGTWVYKEQTFTVPVGKGGDYRVYILVKGGSDPTNLSIYNYVDDLRIHPADSKMKTYTYDPLIGISAESDERNIPVHYIYDDLGRLEKILDQDRNILKQYEYHYKD